jgi:hypothetical protein
MTCLIYGGRQDPVSNSMPAVKTIGTTAPSTGLLGVSVQNSAASSPGDAAPTLSVMDPYTPENRTIDIYARGSGSMEFTISSSAAHIKISPSSGTVSYPSGTSDIRAFISVDWSAAPTGSSTASITVTPKNGTAVKLTLPLNNFAVPTDFKGYVESNGAVAMELQHFTSRTAGSSGATIEVIPNYGRTDSGLTLMPSTAGTQTTATGPKLVYSFFSYTAASNTTISVYLPPSFNTNPSNTLKYAIAIDRAIPTTVTPVPSATLGDMPGGWQDSVVNGARVVSISIGKVEPGKHELALWLLEPGTVVQRVVVDLGGMKSSYLGPPESAKVGF